MRYAALAFALLVSGPALAADDAPRSPWSNPMVEAAGRFALRDQLPSPDKRPQHIRAFWGANGTHDIFAGTGLAVINGRLAYFGFPPAPQAIADR